MGKKFYAVRVGKEHNKIYTTWEEAKRNIDGIKGAQYKGFNSREEAERYIAGENIPQGKWYGVQSITGEGYVFDTWEGCQAYQQGHTCNLPGKAFKNREDAEAYARGEEISPKDQFKLNDETLPTFYIDGSCIDGKIGYGISLRYKDEWFSYFGRTEGDQRNITGELAAFAITYHTCQEYIAKGQEDFNHVNIVYDYEGILNWLTGVWKIRKPEAQLYRDFFDQTQALLGEKKITFEFYKVPSHKGIEGNTKADALAKKGAQREGRYYPLRNMLKVEALSTDETVI